MLTINPYFQYNPNLLIYSNIGEYTSEPIRFKYDPHYPNTIIIIQKYTHLEGSECTESKQFYQLDHSLHIFFDEDIILNMIISNLLIYRKRVRSSKFLIPDYPYGTECKGTTNYRLTHIPRISNDQDSINVYGIYLPVLPSEKLSPIIESIVEGEWNGERFPLPKKIVSEHLWPTQNEVWNLLTFGDTQQYFGYGVFKIKNKNYLLYSTESHLFPEIYLANLQSTMLYPKTLVLFSVYTNPYAWILPSNLCPENYFELYNSYENFQLLKLFIDQN